jgi:hypothetical protein
VESACKLAVTPLQISPMLASGVKWGALLAKWMQLTVAALVAFGLLAFATFQWVDAAGAQSTIERHANYDAQVQRNQATGAVERSCADVPAPKRAACQNQTYKPYEDAEREIRDLEAQQVSALWNRVIGRTAIVGMAVGIIGLTLVFTTFWETRKGNLIQLAAQRPWVTIEVRPVLARQEMPQQMHFRTSVITRNVGQRPATHLMCQTKMMFLGEGDNYATIKPRVMEQLETWYSRMRPPAARFLAPNEVHESPYWDSFALAEMRTTKAVGIDVARPVVLSAVYYRWESEPKTLQVVWSLTRVHSVNPAGDEVSVLYIDRDSSGAEINASPMTGTRYETRAARKYDDTQDT